MLAAEAPTVLAAMAAVRAVLLPPSPPLPRCFLLMRLLPLFQTILTSFHIHICRKLFNMEMEECDAKVCANFRQTKNATSLNDLNDCSTFG